MLTTKGFSAKVRMSLSTKTCWIWLRRMRFCLLIFFKAKRCRVSLCLTRYTALGESHQTSEHVLQPPAPIPRHTGLGQAGQAAATVRNMQIQRTWAWRCLQVEARVGNYEHAARRAVCCRAGKDAPSVCHQCLPSPPSSPVGPVADQLDGLEVTLAGFPPRSSDRRLALERGRGALACPWCSVCPPCCWQAGICTELWCGGQQDGAGGTGWDTRGDMQVGPCSPRRCHRSLA